MQARSLFKKLLGWKGVSIKSVEQDTDGLVLNVRLTSPAAVCSQCGKRAPVYDREFRKWRHLDIAQYEWRIGYQLRRANCPHCGVHVEQVPWASLGAWHTRDFEDQVAFLAQNSNKTMVSNQMRIAWKTVGTIITRVMERHGPKDRMKGLSHIGVDELCWADGKFITIVYDHCGGGVVWMAEGKSKDTLTKFFTALGEEGKKLIQVVTMDMAKAFVQAVKEAVPHAQIVFDRFHVQRLAHDALDDVRRAEVRNAGGPSKAPGLKKLRWTLQKNNWNLTLEEKDKITRLATINQRLYRAYLLKEFLCGILDGLQWKVAEKRLKEWMGWAQRSRLEPFKKLARTIKQHLDGILAYIRTGLNNGMAEGINGKIRVVTKQAYGFHNVDSLMAMIFLCCAGLKLRPVHANFRNP